MRKFPSGMTIGAVVLRLGSVGPLNVGWDSWKVKQAILDHSSPQWNVQMLIEIPPQQIVDMTLSIPLPSFHEADDAPCWPDSKGVCSARSAYHRINNYHRISNDTWSWLWHIPLPPNILIFLWKVMHNRLATKSNMHWLENKACKLCRLSRNR